MRKKMKIHLIAGSCLTLSLASLLLWQHKRQPQLPDLPGSYPHKGSISYTLRARNLTLRTLSPAKLWVHIPVEQTAYQRAYGESGSTPTKTLSDGLRNRIFYFEFENLKPREERTVTLRFSFDTTTEPNRLLQHDLSKYLMSEAGLESDAPEVKKVATDVQGKDTPETARNLQKWLKENITLTASRPPTLDNQAALPTEPGPLPGKPTGVLEILKSKTTPAPNLSYVAAAVLRSAQIPARIVCGFRHRDGNEIKKSDFASWVEYHDGTLWRVLDPQPSSASSNEKYVAMKVLGSGSYRNLGDITPHDLVEGIGLDVELL